MKGKECERVAMLAYLMWLFRIERDLPIQAREKAIDLMTNIIKPDYHLLEAAKHLQPLWHENKLDIEKGKQVLRRAIAMMQKSSSEVHH